MQVVIKPDRHIAPGCSHGQLLMPLTRPMHHGKAVWTHPVNHAIVDELARIVQHTGVNSPARHQLFHIAGGCPLDHVARGGAGQMHFFQP